LNLKDVIFFEKWNEDNNINWKNFKSLY
jgi:hypothetical protein